MGLAANSAETALVLKQFDPNGVGFMRVAEYNSSRLGIYFWLTGGGAQTAIFPSMGGEPTVGGLNFFEMPKKFFTLPDDGPIVACEWWALSVQATTIVVAELLSNSDDMGQSKRCPPPTGRPIHIPSIPGIDWVDDVTPPEGCAGYVDWIIGTPPPPLPDGFCYRRRIPLGPIG